MSVRKWIDQLVDDESVESMLLAEGFDSALLGYMQRCGQPPVAVYDREACIKVLEERDKMSRLEAEEFFEFNVVGGWVGTQTPAFLVRPEEA